MTDNTYADTLKILKDLSNKFGTQTAIDLLSDSLSKLTGDTTDSFWQAKVAVLHFDQLNEDKQA